uniref:Uncharacterized protein n=1 Tax=Polytomella parva TaxID=51329 RepID=A0A6U0Z7P2_9CHLO|mmetsp:Transcript_8004/g.15553  ORF Transcript_8004/g.15553 Transcript_8004/m.15553 type:complete len:578 (-) Transcript_8004:62-1795(-)|eukprot:CAMPEP_0175041670 /NCGR_PEP_ID=MMETSP0052_2-20121109/2068_1 /TAXON_ID=51329 ORGANISM="Polytomella parva, Strain SAG 63-3" /NCGR_SAMPLE_ID=MMETSP0052_2 /ASSEMBLY_ACC=CAM_ASM_000194 /LENGTH=577 /DNA_ID=CAMNT_0016304259 /DNA_START=187 /DNA_END=1920 /DNA_ORIENTATION=+
MAATKETYDEKANRSLQARTQQDLKSGARDYVSGRYNSKFAAQHVTRKALRSSIADAYAAYAGQVLSLPDDTYGLALYALDRTFAPHRPFNTHDFNLHSSPFASSKLKHAQIFNTACQIMKGLGSYKDEVLKYLPAFQDSPMLSKTSLQGKHGPQSHHLGTNPASSPPFVSTVPSQRLLEANTKGRSKSAPPDSNHRSAPVHAAVVSDPIFHSSKPRSRSSMNRRSMEQMRSREEPSFHRHHGERAAGRPPHFHVASYYDHVPLNVINMHLRWQEQRRRQAELEREEWKEDVRSAAEDRKDLLSLRMNESKSKVLELPGSQYDFGRVIHLPAGQSSERTIQSGMGTNNSLRYDPRSHVSIDPLNVSSVGVVNARPQNAAEFGGGSFKESSLNGNNLSFSSSQRIDQIISVLELAKNAATLRNNPDDSSGYIRNSPASSMSLPFNTYTPVSSTPSLPFSNSIPINHPLKKPEEGPGSGAQSRYLTTSSSSALLSSADYDPQGHQYNGMDENMGNKTPSTTPMTLSTTRRRTAHKGTASNGRRSYDITMTEEGMPLQPVSRRSVRLRPSSEELMQWSYM